MELVTISPENFIINILIITAILLLLAYWIIPSQRKNTKELIIVFHAYLIIGSLIFLAFTTTHILSYANIQSENEKWYEYWRMTLFKGLLPQLLWIKKIRQSIWASFLLTPFLLSNLYMQLVHSQRDFLPTPWTVYGIGYTGLFLTSAIFILVLFITFKLTRSRKSNP